MTTMTMMTTAASKIGIIVMMGSWDDNDSGVEVMAGMTEWWQWSRREEEENATGSNLVFDCSQSLKLFWVIRRNGKRCRRRDKCHNSYKEPEHKYVESHQVRKRGIGQEGYILTPQHNSELSPSLLPWPSRPCVPLLQLLVWPQLRMVLILQAHIYIVIGVDVVVSNK